MQTDDYSIDGRDGRTSGNSSFLNRALAHTVRRAKSLDRASSPVQLAEELVLEIAEVAAAVEPGDPVAIAAIDRAIRDLAALRFARPEALIMAVWVSVVLHGLKLLADDGGQAEEAWPGAFAAVLDIEVLIRARREGRFPMSVREAEDYLEAAFRSAAESN